MSVEDLKNRFKKFQEKKKSKPKKKYSNKKVFKKREMQRRLELIQSEIGKYSSVSEMAKSLGIKTHEAWYVINNNREKFEGYLKIGPRFQTEKKKKYIPIVREYYEGKGTLKELAKKHDVSENTLFWYKKSLRDELGYKPKKRGIPVK